MSDLIEREYLLNIARQEEAYGYVSEHEILNAPTAEPKEYVKDGTLTVQMPTIKEAKAIDKIVVYADTYKQEYYMPLPKVGKWEQPHVYRIEDTTIDTLQSTYCPICHRYHTTPYIYSFNHYDYCPNCGAKMERSE